MDNEVVKSEFEIVLQKACELIQLKRYQEANFLLQQYQNDESNSIKIDYLLAKTYKALGKTEAAINIWEKMILKDPTDCDAYRAIAKIHEEQQKYSDAFEAYKRFMSVLSKNNETDVNALLRVIFEFGDKTPPKDVLKCAISFVHEKFLNSNADTGYVLSHLAQLSLMMEDWEEAIRYTMEATALDPYPLYFADLAYAQYALGFTEQAIETLEQALASNNCDLHGCNRILYQDLIILSKNIDDKQRSEKYRQALQEYAEENDLDYINEWLKTN